MLINAMFSNKFYVIILFFSSLNYVLSQEINVELGTTVLPKSIYSKNILTEKNSTFLTNNKLNLKQYKFVFLDVKKIEDGYFTIPLKNIAKPSDFIFETYKDIYNKRNLEKSFFDISKLYSPYVLIK